MAGLSDAVIRFLASIAVHIKWFQIRHDKAPEKGHPNPLFRFIACFDTLH